MSKREKEKRKMSSKEKTMEPDKKMEQEPEVPEQIEAQPAETEAPEKPQEPKEKTELEIAQDKANEYLAMAQRVQADFENYRRRNESVRAESFAEGKRDVAAAMLPVLDNLERAADAAEQSADEALKNGVLLVLKQMNDVYAKLKVTPINRLGEKFDPNLENAILQGTAEEGEPGTVCQVLQKGYLMEERVLRHAMVKVVPD